MRLKDGELLSWDEAGVDELYAHSIVVAVEQEFLDDVGVGVPLDAADVDESLSVGLERFVVFLQTVINVVLAVECEDVGCIDGSVLGVKMTKAGDGIVV